MLEPQPDDVAREERIVEYWIEMRAGAHSAAWGACVADFVSDVCSQLCFLGLGEDTSRCASPHPPDMM